MRDVFVMSQGNHQVFYVNISGLYLDAATQLLTAIREKYATNQVAGFVLQENGDWLINP